MAATDNLDLAKLTFKFTPRNRKCETSRWIDLRARVAWSKTNGCESDECQRATNEEGAKFGSEYYCLPGIQANAKCKEA